MGGRARLTTSDMLAAHTHTSVVCRAQADSAPATPSWVPGPAKPAYEVIAGDSLTLKDVLPAQAMEIIESKDFKDNTGFVPMAETVNGRAAMWAFLTGVFAEIGSGDTVMQQFASCPVRRARDRGGL